MVNIKSMNRSPADMQYVRGRTNIGESVRCQGKCLLMIGSGIDPTIDLQMFHGGYSGIGSALLASSSRDIPILRDLIGKGGGCVSGPGVASMLLGWSVAENSHCHVRSRSYTAFDVRVRMTLGTKNFEFRTVPN